jgi:hypothetical protein
MGAAESGDYGPIGKIFPDRGQGFRVISEACL